MYKRKKTFSILLTLTLCILLSVPVHSVHADPEDETEGIINEVNEEQEEQEEQDAQAEDENNSHDDTFTGENQSSLEIITGMDEEGNIYEVPQENIEIPKENSPLTRSTSSQIVDFNTKSSSQTTDFTEAVTGIAGYTNGAYGADAAYLGTENGKVKFMLSGVIGLVAPQDVRILNISSVKSISFYEVSGGNLIHRITTNVTGSNYASNLNNGPAPSYLSNGVKYYSYDGHYFYTYENFGAMLTDYANGVRTNSINPTSPFYNYFQYLPFRSKTSYSGDALTTMINNKVQGTSKLKNMGGTFVDKQNLYGTNALLISGIAANESAWGMSNISQTKNNLFGINAIDSSPGQSANTFPDTVTCIKEYTETFISKQYLNPSNWKYYGGFLGNKASGMNLKYASDPYWGEKAAAIAWSLDNDGGRKDAYQYTVGIKDTINSKHTNLNVRTEATTSATAVYSTGTQSNHSFLILNTDSSSGFYKIQSDPVLDGTRKKIASSGAYDYNNMYLYASSGYITIVSKGNYKDDSNNPDNSLIRYNTHVGDVGWQGGFADGATAGTTGQNKKIESINIKINGIEDLGVSYVTHVSDIGWQDWVSDGTDAGTTGKCLPMEAIRISLTGDKAGNYDIYYRTHVSNIGWLGWAKNGEPAGSSGYAYGMEAIEIKIVSKGASAPGDTNQHFVNKGAMVSPEITYAAHVSDIGWQGSVQGGEIAGTTGRVLAMEALKISLKNSCDVTINYRAHVRNIGWQEGAVNSAVAGTTGKNLPIEALQISLSGIQSSNYDIYYRTHVSNIGWMGWAKNGESAGSSGYAYPMEAVQIKILPKGESAPGDTTKAFLSK